MNESGIIISGGGIGGLTAAIAVADAGKQVTIVERAPRFEPIGYGIQIGPNALHVFKRLGLLDKVLSCCSLPECGMLSDALTNELLVELPMADTLEKRFGLPYAVIHRSDLHELLVEACNASPSIEMRNNFDVVRFEDDGSEVTVESAAGDKIVGAALIAADGIWSTIRNQLFPDTPPPFTSRYAAFRCVRLMEEVDPALGKNVVNLRCGNDFHMIHYPLRNGTLFNMVAALRVPEELAMDDREGVVAAFERAFASACDEVKALLPYIDLSRYWQVSNLRPIHEWVKGRVALLGDSAHAMVQAMAQGACQAAEDAIVIAKHLGSGVPIEQAFARYHAERHQRATYTQFRSLFMWELIHAQGGWRDLRKAKLADMTQEDVLSSLDWLYSAAPGSELASELADFAPVPA